MKFSPFLNSKRNLRNMWWVVVFFLILAFIMFPVIMLSVKYHFEVTMNFQLLIVLAATVICQLLRRKPLTEVFGAFNVRWIKTLFYGILIGAALMLAPAFILFLFGAVQWRINTIDYSSIFSVTILFIAAAVAEELLFRGFIFQRLLSGIGEWKAQLIIGGLFLLTHLNNPGMEGTIKLFASVNIFLASIMFGLAFIRTKSLSMPIGLHFMANWVQGILLGFGVSGNEEASFLKPIFKNAPTWLTGGAFGLEASVPGLISVVLTIFFLYRWKLSSKQKEVINPTSQSPDKIIQFGRS